jgi:hypothetical protein
MLRFHAEFEGVLYLKCLICKLDCAGFRKADSTLGEASLSQGHCGLRTEISTLGLRHDVFLLSFCQLS